MQSTAAELWREWVTTKAMRPQDYDIDLVEHLRRRLGGSGAIESQMDDAGWTPRDLVHALAPMVQSFVGMQRDLLRLLARVGAVSGTGDNIRIAYEFHEDDVLDESLAAFRERVRRMEQTITMVTPLVFKQSFAFKPPILHHGNYDWGREHVESLGGKDRWLFADDLPRPEPAPTGNADVDVLVTRMMHLVRRALDALDALGPDMESVELKVRGRRDPDVDDSMIELYFATTDYWPLYVVSMAHGWADAVRAGDEVPKETLSQVSAWLDKFDSSEPEPIENERLVSEFSDILSLPEWGKRHELYSAWITTVIDQALDERLDFVVTDGVLRFPFQDTLLAHLDSLSGQLEFRCEMRSNATGLVGGGRKGAIQPDYRFLRTGEDAKFGTLAAVEVKQYKRAATTSHRKTLHDYVTNLPAAVVFIVGHGALGNDLTSLLTAGGEHRASVHENVRIGRRREVESFRTELASLLPKPAPASNWPTRVELRWSTRIDDLDLHVTDGESETSYRCPASDHSVLRTDVKHGGDVEIVDFVPDTRMSLAVHVHVFSSGTLHEAEPVLTFFNCDGVMLSLVPIDLGTVGKSVWWDVARVDANGRVTPTEQSRLI